MREHMRWEAEQFLVGEQDAFSVDYVLESEWGLFVAVRRSALAGYLALGKRVGMRRVDVDVPAFARTMRQTVPVFSQALPVVKCWYTARKARRICSWSIRERPCRLHTVSGVKMTMLWTCFGEGVLIGWWVKWAVELNAFDVQEGWWKVGV